MACQLCELNEVAAGVLQHRNNRGSHVCGRHRELGAASLDPLVIALDVVSEEHCCGLALLKHRLLIRFGRGVVIQRQLQLGAFRLLGRGNRQPTIWALTEIGLLGKPEYLRIEAQGLVLIIHVYAGYFDFHFVSPLSRSRSGSRRLLLVFFFVAWSIRSRWRSRASTYADQNRRNVASHASIGARPQFATLRTMAESLASVASSSAMKYHADSISRCPRALLASQVRLLVEVECHVFLVRAEEADGLAVSRTPACHTTRSAGAPARCAR